MAEQDLLARVIEIIRPFAKNQEALAKATATSRVLEDLKVNSARMVDIILAFEKEFEIEVGDDEAAGVETIGDVIKILEARLAPR